MTFEIGQIALSFLSFAIIAACRWAHVRRARAIITTIVKPTILIALWLHGSHDSQINGYLWNGIQFSFILYRPQPTRVVFNYVFEFKLWRTR